MLSDALSLYRACCAKVACSESVMYMCFCKQGRAEEKLSRNTALDLYSLNELHMLRDPVTQTKCVVAWGTDTLVVAFRGTANCQNATHDMKVSSCCM